ncbi:LPXTG cell wall anchor domain-containing protein [Listeria monocytogenes]|nr:LPXTG cell wall anchor domain-containing protein [Listeria monocytogenes]
MKYKNNSFKQIISIMTVLSLLFVVFGVHDNNQVEAATTSVAMPGPINQIFPDADLAEGIRAVLQKSSVTDVVTKEELESITQLTVTEGEVASIEGLEYLTNLEFLNLNGNQISDLSPLSNLIKLMEVYLSDNEIDDISELKNLTNITDLNLSENNISDLSALANLTKMDSLSLGEDPNISDLNPLSNMTRLNFLGITNAKVKNLTPLTNLTRLNTLVLTENQIEDLSPIAGLKNLTSFNAGSNQINDLTPLNDLEKLKYLTLTDNQVSDISPLANLSQLIWLQMGTNQISDMSALKDLTNLNMLDLKRNQISDIAVLENLTSLTSLQLEYNQIENVEVIGELTNLTSLYLTQNHITDISPLASLTEIESSDFTNQMITNPERNFSKTLSIPNNITSIDGALIAPQTMSNNGTYDAPNLKWSSQNYLPEVKYSFSQKIAFKKSSGTYSGYVTQPLKELLDYKVTFNVDGNTSEVKTVTEEDLIPEPTNPTKQGYTFDGWYDAETGGTKWDFTTMKMPANDVTLYAHFTINNYQANFDIDGAVTNETITYDTLLNEPAAPNKLGYTFDGWYDAETGGTKWDFATMKMPANDVTLYAHFTINDYQANFDIDSAVTEEAVLYDALIPEPMSPSKTGFTFEGWYDAEIGGTKWDFKTMKMPANDITLYAHFSKKTPLIPSPTDEPDSKPTNGPITINEPSVTSTPSQNNNITVKADENTPELAADKLPKTGDDTPWQTLFAGILISSSAFYIWRKKA